MPYTSYALTMAARCSRSLDEPERALAALRQATVADPRAVTPLIELRHLAEEAKKPSLSEWARYRLDSLTGQSPLARRDTLSAGSIR